MGELPPKLKELIQFFFEFLVEEEIGEVNALFSVSKVPYP